MVHSLSPWSQAEHRYLLGFAWIYHAAERSPERREPEENSGDLEKNPLLYSTEHLVVLCGGGGHPES